MSHPENPASPLLAPWQRGYLKFQGRDPRTLEELAVTKADAEHRRRMAEIKAMRAKLAQLDPLVAPLAALGISLGHRDFNTHDQGKTLRLYGALSLGDGFDTKLRDALISLGFRETERKSLYAGARSDVVTLKHGRALVIVLEVARGKPDDPSPAAAAAPTAELEAVEVAA